MCWLCTIRHLTNALHIGQDIENGKETGPTQAWTKSIGHKTDLNLSICRITRMLRKEFASVDVNSYLRICKFETYVELYNYVKDLDK